VKARLSGPDRWREDALIRIVLKSGQAAAAADDRSPGETSDIRKATLTAIEAAASESLRTRLAGLMASPDMPETLFNELWPCLAAPRKENLPAQLALYGDRRLDESAVVALETRWIAEADAAWRAMLENPPAAAALWTRPMAEKVEHRLAVLDAWSKDARRMAPVLLAAMIPDESLRAALARVLRRHWEDGPDALEAAGVTRTLVPEPGFLLSVKQLPRKDASPTAAGRVREEAPARAKAAGARAAASKQEARRLHDRVSQAWMRFCEAVGQAQCRRFAAASAAAQDGESLAKRVARWDGVPQPRRDTEVVAAFGLNVAATCDGRNIPRVWYWRGEMRAAPVTVVADFRRQVPDGEGRFRDDHTWIDALAAPRGQDAARSIDVWISRPNKAFAALPDQDQRLIVEVLAVECEGAAAREGTAGHE